MKENYQEPHVKVVIIQVEKGFATSGSFARSDADAQIFDMLFDQAPRNEHFCVDDWNSNESDNGQFVLDDWGSL